MYSTASRISEHISTPDIWRSFTPDIKVIFCQLLCQSTVSISLTRIDHVNLQVDPQDIVMLVLSWHMKTVAMCEFSKQEFIGGVRALGIDTLERFHEITQYVRSKLNDEQKFRDVYNFTFGWADEKARHKKAISRDTWSQLLEFARSVDSKLSNYDAEGAWPYLIDEIVEYLHKHGIIQKDHVDGWAKSGN